MIWDEWQKQVLKCERNFILMCGRQTGKSEVVSHKIANYLINNPNKKIMIVSGVERQAAGLYNKVLAILEKDHSLKIKRGKNKPLKTKLQLKNGSILITEPVGLDGAGARQHTLHGVIFEEMQLIPEDAFAAITPMLLTTGGFLWMLGTAWATEGYVYERLSDPEFEVFRINSEEVAEQRKEPMRTIMKEHLRRERERLSESMYAQEYLAIPSSKLRQIFNDELIAACQTENRPEAETKTETRINKNNTYICGVDPAGLGEDQGSISIFKDEDKFIQIEHEITQKLLTTQTTERILNLDNIYDFEKIYIDDGGVGFGVFSELLNEGQTKNKVVALNNASRSLDWKDEKRKKILQEDMIFNLLRMMERRKIALLKDSEIRESLKSYKFEYHKDTKKLIITSNYNHPVQSIMRAAWHKEKKELNMAVYTIPV